MERHVFIVGSKGIPANYGGYETFVEYLTKYRQNENIHYHIACKTKDKNKSDGRVFIKGQGSSDFDIKI